MSQTTCHQMSAKRSTMSRNEASCSHDSQLYNFFLFSRERKQRKRLTPNAKTVPWLTERITVANLIKSALKERTGTKCSFPEPLSARSLYDGSHQNLFHRELATSLRSSLFRFLLEGESMSKGESCEGLGPPPYH